MTHPHNGVPASQDTATAAAGMLGLVDSNLPAINTRIEAPNLTFVPYFAPREVHDPLPVFKENKRTSLATAAGGRGSKDKTASLYAWVDKLKSMTADNGTFRKLARLAKEAALTHTWDQGGAEEGEVWAGAENDGGNFVELVQGTVLYLDVSNPCAASAIELVRQLSITQAGLFAFYERKVDEHGMTLEARLIERLLAVRASEDMTVSTAAEDALDAFLGSLDANTVFDVLFSYLAHRLILEPNAPQAAGHGGALRYHPVGSAFTYLGRCVKEAVDTFLVEEWLTQGGVNVFFKVNKEKRGLRVGFRPVGFRAHR